MGALLKLKKMTQLYNQFNTYQEALIPAILDTMQWIRDKNDDNGYTQSVFGSVEKFQELDNFYQDYLDGNKTNEEVLTIYSQNVSMVAGRWANIKEGLDGKFYYPIYENSLHTYTTIENPPFPVEEPV